MTDRVPGAPGQYKAVVTDSDLQKMQAGEQFTITLVRDDQPITEGTPYSKAAVLPDELAAVICPGVTDPSPADALASIWAGKAPASHATDKNNPHGVTAAQVGARPNTWLPTPAEIGASPMEYAKKVGNPYNLLVNSDFQNPVNQRGFVSGSEVPAGAYFIDRWRNSYSGVSQYPVLDGNGISNLTEVVEQPVDLSAYVGKPVTIAIYETCDKPICCASGVVVKSAEWNAFAFSSNWEVRIYSANNGWYACVQVPCKCIALYPGEYTLDTLPAYQPKGYAVELAACNVLETEHLSGAKVLWLNASTNSSFAAQTITVPHLNEYNAVMVVFENNEGGAGNYAHLALKEAMGTWWCDVTNARSDSSVVYVVTRRVVVHFDTNTITFESGSQNGVENNMRGIPYAVYGLQRG